MGNVSRKMEILKKKQTEMLKNRKPLTEMKTAFSTLIYKHVTAEERLFEDLSIDTSKTEKQREQKKKITEK